MNLTYAIPAVITLTAHALIFIGSGGPPIRHVPPVPPVSFADPFPEIEVVDDTPSPKTDDDDAGGETVREAPPGVPEPPPTVFPTGPQISQDHTRIKPGKATKIEAGAFGPPGGEDRRTAVSVSKLDNPPRTRVQNAPSYPNSLKAGGITGTVWVEFVVDERGWVNDVRVVKTTNSGFDEATRSAVSQWRFEPGKRKGIPVSFRMSIPIVFNLND
ncbi:MAG: energy transducer TonB [Verrucomicrobia bacterium]|nr:energy transducer TonB [Verrucomicrobiota bacterium]